MKIVYSDSNFICLEQTMISKSNEIFEFSCYFSKHLGSNVMYCLLYINMVLDIFRWVEIFLPKTRGPTENKKKKSIVKEE